MTITVPTWTIALPIAIGLCLGLVLTLRYIDARWITPWIDRKLADRWGCSVADIHRAREEMHRRGDW